MFADNSVRKQAYLDWKIRIIPGPPMGIFFKGVNPWLCSKIDIFSLLAFQQNTRWNNVSWPSSKKTSLPTLKNKDFTKSPYADLF